MSNEAIIEKIKQLKNEVFTEEGYVKLCGRDKCKELMRLCRELKPGVNFGNTDTGFMEINTILEFINSIE